MSVEKQRVRELALISIALCLLATITAAQAATTGAASAEGRQRYDVAAFVWPSYHPDERARIFWPKGIGEWETVMENQPKFPGHKQPRRPLWGYVNEADPYVMEMQIAASADHGVNVFIYDWYWYDGLPFLEGALNNGYLKARNNDRVKFYLMWANHIAPLLWDKRNSDHALASHYEALIWRGQVGREEFEKIARRWINEYFSQPSYYRIDDRPVFMIYDVPNFLAGMGGVRQAKEALDWFRAETKKAGFAGLELQVSLQPRLYASVDAERKIIGQLAFDSATHYQFFHFLDMDRNYEDVVKDAAAAWEKLDAKYAVKYYPQVSVGWDASPRRKEFVGSVVRNNTPEEFGKALLKAKQFIDAHPDRAPLIVVNSWNEWTETSYLQPDDEYGYGYLEAVKRVLLK